MQIVLHYTALSFYFSIILPRVGQQHTGRYRLMSWGSKILFQYCSTCCWWTCACIPKPPFENVWYVLALLKRGPLKKQFQMKLVYTLYNLILNWTKIWRFDQFLSKFSSQELINTIDVPIRIRVCTYLHIASDSICNRQISSLWSWTIYTFYLQMSLEYFTLLFNEGYRIIILNVIYR